MHDGVDIVPFPDSSPTEWSMGTVLGGGSRGKRNNH